MPDEKKSSDQVSTSDAMMQYAKAWWSRNDELTNMQKFEGRMLLYVGTKSYLTANGELERDVASNFVRILMQEGAGLAGMAGGGFVGGVLGGMGGIGVGGFLGGVAGAEWGNYRFEKEVQPIIDKYLPKQSEIIKRQYNSVLSACAEMPNKVWYDRNLTADERIYELSELKKDYLRVARELNDVDPIIAKAILDYVKLTLVPRIEHLQPAVGIAENYRVVTFNVKDKKTTLGQQKSAPLSEHKTLEVSKFLSGYGVPAKELDTKSRYMISQIIDQYEEARRNEKLREEGLNFLGDAFGILNVLGQVSGKDNLVKIANIGSQTVGLMKSISALPGALTAASAAGSPLAFMQPLSAILLGGLLLFGALRKKKNNSDGGMQALMKQLQDISQQINALHESMQKNFQQVYRGQEQIFRAVIEGTRHLDKLIQYELKNLREPLFHQLDFISNRLLLLDQIITTGINAIELQPLMGYKDHVDYLVDHSSNFEGDRLIANKQVYKELLAWSRTHCKSPNLNGKNRLQISALKAPPDTGFSTDAYNVINEVLGGEKSNISIQVGYLAEFARQVLGMNIDTEGMLNLENWIITLKLLFKLQAMTLKHNAQDLNSALIDTETVIKVANSFNQIVRELQNNSHILFEGLTKRYQQSYHLFMHHLHHAIQQRTTALITGDARMQPPLDLFKDIPSMGKELALEKVFSLYRHSHKDIELYLAPSMLRASNSAVLPHNAADTNARDVKTKEHNNFRESIDIDKIVADFASALLAKNISQLFLTGSIVGHGQFAIRIDELSRQNVIVYSPNHGVIHANPPGAAKYKISLIYIVNDTNAVYEVMHHTYSVNPPYRHVGNFDTRGNGAQKMQIAIAQHQAQYHANNVLAAADFFQLVWPSLSIVEAETKIEVRLLPTKLLDNSAKIVPQEINDDKKAPSFDEQKFIEELELSIAKKKVDVLVDAYKDVALQSALTRLNADYSLITSFAAMIGFDSDNFRKLIYDKSKIISRRIASQNVYYRVDAQMHGNDDVFTILGVSRDDMARSLLEISSNVNHRQQLSGSILQALLSGSLKLSASASDQWSKYFNLFQEKTSEKEALLNKYSKLCPSVNGDLRERIEKMKQLQSEGKGSEELELAISAMKEKADELENLNKEMLEWVQEESIFRQYIELGLKHQLSLAHEDILLFAKLKNWTVYLWGKLHDQTQIIQSYVSPTSDKEFHLLSVGSERKYCQLVEDNRVDNLYLKQSLLQLLNSALLDRIIYDYIMHIKNTRSVVNITDPISMLSHTDMNATIEKLLIEVNNTKTLNQFDSPLSLVIEDQLSQLVLNRARILALQSNEELRTMKDVLFAEVSDQRVVSCDFKLDNQTNDYAVHTETSTQMTCDVLSGQCNNNDVQLIDTHDKTLLSNTETENDVHKKIQNDRLQTSPASHAMPFYAEAIQVFYEKMLEIGKRIVSDDQKLQTSFTVTASDLIVIDSVVINPVPHEQLQLNTQPQYECQLVSLNGMPALDCVGESYRTLVFPKGSESTAIMQYSQSSIMYTPIQSDIYDISSCHAVEFYGRPSVYCEGQRTTFIYQPDLPNPPLQNMDGQIMLFAVGAYLVKQVVGWFGGSNDMLEKRQITEVVTTVARDKQLTRCKEELNNIETILQKFDLELLTKKHKWILDGVTDYRGDIEAIEKLKHVTKDQLYELYLDIEYFCSEVQEELKGINAQSQMQSVATHNPCTFFAMVNHQNNMTHLMVAPINNNSLSSTNYRLLK